MNPMKASEKKAALDALRRLFAKIEEAPEVPDEEEHAQESGCEPE